MVTGVRRIVLWFMSTLTTVVLLFGYHTSTSGPDATVAGSGSSSGFSAGQTSTGSGSSTRPTSRRRRRPRWSRLR